MDTRTDKIFSLGLFVALFLKYMLFGFQYYPVLDDYIQYGCYPLYDNVAADVFGRIGTVATRPLASLLDPLLWGRMWDCMWLALILITLLHFMSYLLLQRIFRENGLGVSPVVYILFLLFPVAAEGTYWISASSRVVVGMFFVLLSLCLLTRYVSKRKWYILVLSALFLLISFGFYEQVAVFGFCAYILLLVYNRKRIRWVPLLSIPAACAVALAAYYVLAAGIGEMGNRAAGFSPAHLWGNLLPFIRQLYEIYIVGTVKLVLMGGYRGFISLLDCGAILAILFIALSAVSAAQIGSIAAEREAGSHRWLWVGGLVLFFAPFAPYLLVEEAWLTYRSVFPSLIGLGLLLEPLSRRLLSRQVPRTVLLMAVTFLFIFSNVNEYKTYRETAAYDDAIVTQLAGQLDEQVLAGQKRVAVLSGAPSYVPQVNCYKDHIKSVTYSDWSLTGALRAKCRNVHIQNVLLVTSYADLEDAPALADMQVFGISSEGEVSPIRWEQ